MSFDDRDYGELVGKRYCVAREVGKGYCHSSDALAIYRHTCSDGGYYHDAYCWSCGTMINAVEFAHSSLAREFPNSDTDIESLPMMQNNASTKPTKKPITRDEIRDLFHKTTDKAGGYRGIKDEIYKFFGYRFELDDQGNLKTMYIPETYSDLVDKKTKMNGYKPRILPKRFGHPIGRTGKTSQFIGQQKFEMHKNHKDVLIVGGECFTSDTQLMTRDGWVSIKDIVGKQTDEVMQVHDDLSSDFVNPTSYIEKQYNGLLYNYSNKYYDSLTTAQHNIVASSGKYIYKFKAKDGVRSKAHHSPLAVSLTDDKCINTHLTNDQLAFIIAIAADSKVDYYKSGTIKAHLIFSKDRKKDRFKNLLHRLNLKYTSYIQKMDNCISFNVALPSWCKDKGLPESWLYSLSQEQRIFVLKELTYWDGNFVKDRKSTEFSSNKYQEADLVRNLAKISGIHASLRYRSNSLGSWYAVKINWGKKDTSWQRMHLETIPYKGYVYCVSVPTGMLLVKRNEKVFVTGNCDVPSAYQMLSAKTKKGYTPPAVVSPTTGEGGLKNQCIQEFDFLDQFENIILGLDNDDRGIEEMQRAIPYLPKDKVKIAYWTDKDPNEMLVSGHEKQFLADFYNAKPLETNGILNSSEILPLVDDELDMVGISLPPYMSELQNMMPAGLFPTGIIANIIADTSTGKSSTVNAIVHHWLFNSPYKVGVASLEATAARYLLDMISLHIGENFMKTMTRPEVKEYIKQPEVMKRYQDLFKNEDGTDRWSILDERDGDIKLLEKQMEILVKKFGCRILVVDVLSDILRGSSKDFQEDHMKFQKSMVKSGVTIVNVLHTNKSVMPNMGMPTRRTEYDALGSSSFVQSAAINIVLNRNKMADNWIEKNSTYVDMPKCRDGLTGRAGCWLYDVKSRLSYDRNKYFQEHKDLLPTGYDLNVSSFDRSYYDKNGEPKFKFVDTSNEININDMMDGINLEDAFAGN